jgi:hypothetical protein
LNSEKLSVSFNALKPLKTLLQSILLGVYEVCNSEILFVPSVAYLLIWNIVAKVIIFNDLLAKYATFFYPFFAFLAAC